MSGSIKYRLTPRERDLFIDDLSIFAGLRAQLDRLKAKRVVPKLDDPEMVVSVEEKDEGPSIEIEYPFDNDSSPKNGRFIVKDSFQVSKENLQLSSYSRSLSQDVNRNKLFSFWLNLASDYLKKPLDSREEGLNRFLVGLNEIGPPDLDSREVQRFSQEVLLKLHRPFPADIGARVKANRTIFEKVWKITNPRGIRMKLGDPQSGVNLRREGDKIFLTLQVVLDNDPKSGLESEKNGRMFMIDNYELDAKTHLVSKFQRDFLPSQVDTPSFAETAERLQTMIGSYEVDAKTHRVSKVQKDSPSLKVDTPKFSELKDFTANLLEDLGIPPGEDEGKDSAIVLKSILPPESPGAKELYALYQTTESHSEAQNPTAQELWEKVASDWRLQGLPQNALDRQALHDALGLFLAGDKPAAAKGITDLANNTELSPETRAILQSLKSLAQDDDAATQAGLAKLGAQSPLIHRLQRAAELFAKSRQLKSDLEILKTATLERLEQEISHDRAWIKSISRALFGGSARNPEQLRLAVEAFFKNFQELADSETAGLRTVIADTDSHSPYENEVKAMLTEDPALFELADILSDPPNETRQTALLFEARRRLQGEIKLPATALAIVERADAALPEVAELRNWLTGRASFSQKIEMFLPQLVKEITSLKTLTGMAVSGSLAQVGKAAFLCRYYQTRALHLASEAIAVAIEAPSFVLSEKLLGSTFVSPDRQWAHLGRETLGAVLAFGTLRIAGLAGKRLANSLDASAALEKWSTTRSRWPRVTEWIPKLKEFSAAEGRLAQLRRPVGALSESALRYLGETGISRRWVPSVLKWGGTHGLSMTALSTANGLSRFLGLREASKQGWKADTIDDFLMYGQFMISANLAHNIGWRGLDLYIAHMESAMGRGTDPVSETNNGDKTAQAQGTPQPDGESDPKFDLPPEIKQFGRHFTQKVKELAGRWKQSIRNKRTPKVPGAALRPMAEPIPFRDVGMLKPPSQSDGEKTRVLECILGREEMQNPSSPAPRLQRWIRPWRALSGRVIQAWRGGQAADIPPARTGIDFGFPSTDRQVAPQHAKITGHIELKIQYTLSLGHQKALTQEQLDNIPVADLESLGILIKRYITNSGVALTQAQLDKTPPENLAVLGTLTEQYIVTKRELSQEELLAIPVEHLAWLGVSQKKEQIQNWIFTLEDLNSSTGTFLNGEILGNKPPPLKDGDVITLGQGGKKLIFLLRAGTPEAFLVREEIPLLQERNAWVLGRETSKSSPDIPFPLSDRHVSRRQAQIIHDPSGHYFLQDLSDNGTLLNGRPVNGKFQLEDGDVISLGQHIESQELKDENGNVIPLQRKGREGQLGSKTTLVFKIAKVSKIPRPTDPVSSQAQQSTPP